TTTPSIRSGRSCTSTSPPARGAWWWTAWSRWTRRRTRSRSSCSTSSTGRRSTATPRRWGWRSACPCGSTAGSSTPTATTTPGSRRCSSSPPRRRASRTCWRARSPRAMSARPQTRSWSSAASASATESPGCCASSSTAAAPCPTRSSSTASAAEGSSSSSVSLFRLERLTRAELAARDFTVNARAVSVRELVTRGRAPIVDPTGGLADLRARRLRAPGPRVLAEDPLRALRGVRLEAALALRLTPGTVAAIRAIAPALAAVSVERVRDELLAMLALPDATRAFRRADALGLLGVLLPEVEPMRATAQPAPHRFPVLEHSLRAMAGADRVLARLAALEPFGEELRAHMDEPLGGGVTRGPVLKLAALLHDVAKPETRRVVEGRVRF